MQWLVTNSKEGRNHDFFLREASSYSYLVFGHLINPMNNGHLMYGTSIWQIWSMIGGYGIFFLYIIISSSLDSNGICQVRFSRRFLG
jgi:hypothetical protein